ncbi:MAG: DUF1127 domain-containing protein [Pseudomonadota bacterium]
MQTETLFPAFRSLAITLGRVSALPYRLWANAMAERQHLAGLDDRLLRDAGIDAAARAAELDKPFWDVTSRR